VDSGHCAPVDIQGKVHYLHCGGRAGVPPRGLTASNMAASQYDNVKPAIFPVLAWWLLGNFVLALSIPTVSCEETYRCSSELN